MEIRTMHDEPDGYLLLGDLVALVEFQTHSSAVLLLGRFTNQPLNVPEECADWFVASGPASCFQSCGWVDIHSPCDESGVTYFRIMLPSEFDAHGRVESVIRSLLGRLPVPEHPRFIADCIVGSDTFRLFQPKDQGGIPDRFYS